MIDCNITENYLQEKLRMCKSYDRCSKCPMDEARKQEKAHNMWCSEFCEKIPKKAIEVIQLWSDSHPQKTMLDDFKEKYPNALLNENGIPRFCPYLVGYVDESCCTIYSGCVKCWNRPYEE